MLNTTITLATQTHAQNRGHYHSDHIDTNTYTVTIQDTLEKEDLLINLQIAREKATKDQQARVKTWLTNNPTKNADDCDATGEEFVGSKWVETTQITDDTTPAKRAITTAEAIQKIQQHMT